MNDEFLTDNIIFYIEKEIVENIYLWFNYQLF